MENTVCNTVEDRVSKFAQLLLEFELSLGRYVGSHCHDYILPCRYFILELFPEYPNLIVREYEVWHLSVQTS